MKTVNIILAVFVLSISQLYSQTLFIEMDKDTVSLDERIQVTYKIDDACDASELKFEEFLLVSGPSVSRSISIINGKRTAESSYTVLLTPIDEGVFTLPSSICGVYVEKPVQIVVISGYESKETVDERIRSTRKVKKI